MCASWMQSKLICAAFEMVPNKSPPATFIKVGEFLAIPILIAAVVVPVAIICIKSKRKRDAIKAQFDFLNDMYELQVSKDKIEPTDIEWFEVNKLRILVQIDSERADYVYNELHPDLVGVFGDNYRQKFDITKQPKQAPLDCMRWAIDLLLAHKGKSARELFEIGEGDVAKWNLAVCRKIEGYLTKAHPEELDNLKFYTTSKYSTEPIENTNICLGIHSKNGNKIW